MIDLLINDLPGELEDRERWEDEVLDTCPVCEAVCSPEPSGLCHACHDRYRGAGGCGLATALVAGGSTPITLEHLVHCTDCRLLLLDLGRLAESAEMDLFSERENAHAVSLAAVA